MRISTLGLCATLAAAPLLVADAAPAETSSATTIKSASATLPTPASLADGAYELGGFFGAGDKQEVSLKKRGEASAKWVRVGQKTGDLLVESADPAHGFAIVNIAGARYRLNLRGEKATPLPATGTTRTVTFGSSAKLARPMKPANLSPEMKAKREKFEAIMSKLTPEQHQHIGQTLAKKMGEALRKNIPGSKNGLSQQEMQELSRNAFRDGIREALQMPGKDGVPGTVPSDFNDLFDASSTGDSPVVGAVTAGVQMVPADAADAGAPGAGPAPVQVQLGEPMVITSGDGGATGTIVFKPQVITLPAPTAAPAPAQEK